MTLLNDADALYVGEDAVDKVYLGADEVWSSFSPASLSPIVWAKQSELAALADGAQLATWGELSQGTAAARPTKQTVNGKAVARWAGTDDQMALPSLAALTAATLYIVIKKASDAPLAAVSGYMQVGSSGQGAHLPWTDGTVYDDFGSTARKTVGNPAPALTSWRTYCVTTAAGAWQAFLDNVSLFSTGTNTVGWTVSPQIGFSPPSYWMVADIAELLIFPAAHDATQRALMHDYLAGVTP